MTTDEKVEKLKRMLADEPKIGMFGITRDTLEMLIRQHEAALSSAPPATKQPVRGDAVERVAMEVYEAMRWAIMRAPYHDETPPKWQEGGNSLAQDRARQAAIAALQQPEQSATPHALVEQLVQAIRSHDKWHQEVGEVLFPADPENGMPAPFPIDLSSEYADSKLCEDTHTAIAAAERWLIGE